MTAQVLKCCVLDCAKDAAKKITYDCGTQPDQTLIICEDHFKSKPCWNRHVKSVIPIGGRAE